MIVIVVAGAWIIARLKKKYKLADFKDHKMNDHNRLKLSLNIAVVSGIFSFIVALLLLLNFLQVSKKDPLESKAVEVLVQRLSENPNDDALKNDIRNLDLLARKAYFNSQWQVKTGSHLLLFGAIIFALALQVYLSLKSRIETPDQVVENELKARILSQKWILYSGAAILILALAASFATVDHLKSFNIRETVENQQAAAVEPGIEVIEVGKAPVSVTHDSTGTTDTSMVSAKTVSVTDSLKDRRNAGISGRIAGQGKLSLFPWPFREWGIIL